MVRRDNYYHSDISEQFIKKYIRRHSDFKFDNSFANEFAIDVHNYMKKRLYECEQLAWYDNRKRELKDEYVNFLSQFDDGKMDGLDFLKYYAYIFTGNPISITNWTGEKMKYFSKMAIYVTDDCNYKCKGCSVRNRKKHGYLNAREWRRILKLAKEVTDFIVIFGGEPTTFQYLPEIIKFLNNNDMEYAIITNGLKLKNDKYLKKFLDYKPKNITLSVNHWLGYDETENLRGGFFNKTRNAYEVFDKIEDWEGDKTANFTINKYTYKHLYEMVKEFSDRGIWSILTPLHSMKGDFTNDDVDDYVVPINDWIFKYNTELNEQLDLLIENYDDLLIHAPKEWLIWAKDNMLKFDWKCSYTHMNYACIDSRGMMQACHNIAPSDLKFKDYIEGRRQFEAGFDSHKSRKYERYMNRTKRQIRNCKGCALDHAWSCDFYSRNNLLEQGKKDFQHKR